MLTESRLPFGYPEVASEKLLWSVQSEVINPGKVETVADEYTSMLLDALHKEGLLRKKQ